MHTRKLNWIFLGLLIGLIFLQYRLWCEPGGLTDMLKLKKQFTTVATENDKLKQTNHALLLEVEQLQKNNQLMESRARHELGMIKKGEVFYQMVK